MQLENQICGAIAFIPVLIIGNVLFLFLLKVIRVIKKVPKSMFQYSQPDEESEIKSSEPYFTLRKDISPGEKPSRKLPEEPKFLIIWSRIMGFIMIFFACISMWLLLGVL